VVEHQLAVLGEDDFDPMGRYHPHDSRAITKLSGWQKAMLSFLSDLFFEATPSLVHSENHSPVGCRRLLEKVP
jgi:hypothetical protein